MTAVPLPQSATPIPTSTPTVPTTSRAEDWDLYRLRIIRHAELGHISFDAYKALLRDSWTTQMALPPLDAAPTEPTQLRPTKGRPITLTGARLREAAVLVIRSRRAIDLESVMWMLETNGFVIGGKRPVEVLRKAVLREVIGVHNRIPTVRVTEQGYQFVAASLNDRTRRRWEYRFPTLATLRFQ
jgi:hypothetical protein